MPIYEHKGISAKYADKLVGMSTSGMLSNQGTFCVQLTYIQNCELFSFQSPEFKTHLIIDNGVVEFIRNDKVARKEIGSVHNSFSILISWSPDRFQLALIVDDNIGSDDECITIETKSLFIPSPLIKRARQLNLTPRNSFNSPSEFLGVLLENIRQANNNIRNSNAFNIFWDRQSQKGVPHSRIPKREPESMSGLSAFLQDQSLISGYELIAESTAGAGKLDLRAIAQLSSGGFINICIEGKNAHSNDLEHGVTEQLPEYMRRTNADYGIYLVLWYKCDYFPEPNGTNIDTTLGLTKSKPMKNITVESFDLSLPLYPSNRKFKQAK